MRRLLTICAVVAGLFALAPAAQATPTTYYFSTSGSDTNNGLSELTPKKSAAAFNALVLAAGDTVKFKRGDTWTATTAFLISASEDGTSGARINIQPYGTAVPQPEFKVGSSTQCWRIEGDYVNVDNIKAQTCAYGFNVFGAHTLLQHVHADLNTFAGIKLSNSTSGHAQYSRVTESSFEDNDGTAVSNEAYGVLVNADDTEIDHNSFARTSSTVGDIKGSDVELFDASRTSIHHNWSEDSNGFSEMGRTTVGGDADANSYRYNRVHADCGTDCAEAGGFNIRGAASSYGPNTNTTFEHNTVLIEGGSGEALVCSSQCPDSTVIRDNVLAKTGAGGKASYIDDDGTPGWVETGNVFDGATDPSSFVANATSAEGTMVFAGVGDLRPAAGSLAIDRASTGTVDYYGLANQDGNCDGTVKADSGYAEYDNPNC